MATLRLMESLSNVFLKYSVGLPREEYVYLRLHNIVHQSESKYNLLYCAVSSPWERTAHSTSTLRETSRLQR